MHIEVAVQTHYFQHRLCWMLSSILQADKRDGLKVTVNLAYVAGTGHPTTEDVITAFQQQGLHINSCVYDSTEEFQYRGWVRNRQLDMTEADWILFADSDMVYPLNFFNEMCRLLSGDKYRNNPHCLYSRRFSTELNPTQKLIDKYSYPACIIDAHEQVQVLPGRLKANVGAGYCQIANVALLKKNYGYYQKPGKRIDWSWEKKYQKAKSDMHFRKMLGRQAIRLPVQIHLQHLRDSDFKKHVELQR